MQLPAWQVSDCVHALPSLQVVPFGFGAAEHVPFDGLQVPVLQASLSEEQSIGVPDTQVSVVILHVSTPLQGFPSLQFAFVVQPQALVFTVQPPAVSLQPSMVHAMPSSHTRAVPPQAPLVHLSPVVQIFPSSQVVPSVFTGFEHTPLDGLQVP